jgi:hypothetical protein
LPPENSIVLLSLVDYGKFQEAASVKHYVRIMKKTAARTLLTNNALVFYPILLLLLLLAAGKPVATPAAAAQTASGKQRTVRLPSLAQDTQRSAEFPGGHPALMKYLNEHFQIPAVAFRLKRENQEVRLIMEIEYQVLTDGSASFLRPVLFDIRPKHPAVADAVRQEWIRFFKAMPTWKPALKNDVPVASIQQITLISGYAGWVSWAEYEAIRHRSGSAREPASFTAADLKTKAGKKVYSFVQKNPVFPGGNAALKQYLLAHMPYLRIAASQVNKGVPVVLIIVVNEEGVGEDIQLIQPRIGNLEAETRQALKQMPVWKPGRQGKNTIPVAVTFPILL